MRKLVTALSVAAAISAVAIPSLASAQENQFNTGYAAPIAGAAVGTAVGVGLYNGWYGTTGAFVTGTTLGSAIVTGGVAGVGTVALIDAAFQPCRGFHALFGANKQACANGEYVGERQVRRTR